MGSRPQAVGNAICAAYTTWGRSQSRGRYFNAYAFVKTLPTAGTAGAAVKILGTNLTGASSVSFNGTAAAFAVVSPSEITTTVPTGASAGTVRVTTPRGTLSSNVAFRVTQ